MVGVHEKIQKMIIFLKSWPVKDMVSSITLVMNIINIIQVILAALLTQYVTDL
jgi:hypothetical protein